VQIEITDAASLTHPGGYSRLCIIERLNKVEARLALASSMNSLLIIG
jgi:hypothetical protein